MRGEVSRKPARDAKRKNLFASARNVCKFQTLQFSNRGVPMLLSLRVKNLALVEQARLEWEPGLNVITGETGAGKSILIGALKLLLGERADRKWIRTGTDACGAEAVFDVSKLDDLPALLEELGLPPAEDGQLIVRRIVKENGAGQNLVNDTPVTLQALKRIGERLVDMHGPYDHQSLLNPLFQLDVLDAYGGLESDRAGCREHHRVMSELEAQRDALQGGDEEVSARIDLLQFRINELEEAAPEAGEDDAVAQEHAVASHAQRILELGQGVLSALQDAEGNAFDALAGAQRSLDELARLLPDAAEWKTEARAAAQQIQALAEAMRGALDRVEADPARLDWLEQRLALYQRLKRKYANDAAGLVRLLDESRTALKELSQRGERLAEVEQRIAKARAELVSRGRALGRKRRATAEKLAKAVTAQLRELGFPHGAFDVAIEEAEPGPTGCDAVSFGFAPNLGEARKPLRDIASSGEISRVMLATKAVLAKHDRIPVLVFDEVDANVGGEMGIAVGRKLAALGASHQVICITHLPQVAAQGGTHFAVVKRVRDGRTFTEVDRLDAKARVDEIARMLGGKDLTKVTLQHAKELLAAGRA
ncbi:MAG TPA: DNA repair protein RecN [Kiritimatiellia bacterium]|nr:DNA repair protein RecN [Kiritimatiellia bacterium]